MWYVVCGMVYLGVGYEEVRFQVERRGYFVMDNKVGYMVCGIWYEIWYVVYGIYGIWYVVYGIGQWGVCPPFCV